MRGTPNKATVAKRLDALQQLRREAGLEPGTSPAVLDAALPRAKEELLKLIGPVRSTVAMFQRAALVDDEGTGAPGKTNYNAAAWRDFKDWATLLYKLCNDAADFQDPRFRAIAVAMTPTDPASQARTVEGTAVEPETAQSVYLRLIKGGKPG